MSKLYDRFKVEKVDNGWLIEYYGAGDCRVYFATIEQLCKFIKERWQK